MAIVCVCVCERETYTEDLMRIKHIIQQQYCLYFINWACLCGFQLKTFCITHLRSEEQNFQAFFFKLTPKELFTLFFLSGSTYNQSSTCLFCFIILYYFHKRKIRYTYPNLKINSRLHIFKNNLEILMAFLSCFPSLPVGAH